MSPNSFLLRFSMSALFDQKRRSDVPRRPLSTILQISQNFRCRPVGEDGHRQIAIAGEGEHSAASAKDLVIRKKKDLYRSSRTAESEIARCVHTEDLEMKQRSSHKRRNLRLRIVRCTSDSYCQQDLPQASNAEERGMSSSNNRTPSLSRCILPRRPLVLSAAPGASAE
ncbi:hypothetical protein CEXT_61521 [Caerostris extrusa]|uniref:Uncharacterized protein n=1 Tax=Caerostris extrusa TaxID=172846 RepID=A0AAV4RKE6_CAEEX|nr:hypothetical protein CEXT_61521 [Caerostris extrusa]